MPQRILFFDGYCNLCNTWVDFLMRRDRRAQIHFASLQGETAKKHLPEFAGAVGRDPDSVLYLREGRVYNQSDAILYALRDLGGFWRIFALAFVLPGFLRNPFYRLVAKNRFHLFGRRESCRIPTADERERLLP
ncbi:MAG: DUF393 domain-containing protein [Bradymonadales bacterium]|nr:MAG: DUF393 domain-containing protein [Bradymonadales bacterium]